MRSSRDVDARADIWALGGSLRELLTGELEEGTVPSAGVDQDRRSGSSDRSRPALASARSSPSRSPRSRSDVAAGIAARLVVAKKPSARAPWALAMGLACVAAGGFAWTRAGSSRGAVEAADCGYDCATAEPGDANADASANADADAGASRTQTPTCNANRTRPYLTTTATACAPPSTPRPTPTHPPPASDAPTDPHGLSDRK